MVTFETELSTSSLEALIKDLDKYVNNLDKNIYSINEAIAIEAEKIVNQYVPVDKGDLQRSIKNEVTKEYARIYTENDHALFAEFGTGVVGKGKPHEFAEQNGWVYDHKNQGWVGYEGRRYMYYTYIDMQEKLKTIAEEVLRQRGLI